MQIVETLKSVSLESTKDKTLDKDDSTKQIYHNMKKEIESIK